MQSRQSRTRLVQWLLGACCAGMISGCNIFDRWDAIVYTNKFDRGNSLDIGTYESLEACRAAAKAKMAELKIAELGGYICGENCLVKWGFGNMRMCERTSR